MKIFINYLKIFTVLFLFFSINACNSNSSNAKNKDGGGPEDEILKSMVLVNPVSMKFDTNFSQKVTVYLNTDNKIVKTDEDDVKYEVNFVDENGKAVTLINIDHASVTLTKSNNSQNIFLTSDHLTVGDIYFNVVRKRVTSKQNAKFHFEVVAPAPKNDDIVSAEQDVTLVKSEVSNIIITLNQDSETVKSDPEGTNYKVSLVKQDGSAFDDKVLHSEVVTLTKDSSSIVRVNMPVKSEIASDFQNYYLSVERSGVGFIQKYFSRFQVLSGHESYRNLEINRENISTYAPGVWVDDNLHDFHGWGDFAVNDYGVMFVNLVMTEITEDDGGKALPFVITDKGTKSFYKFNTCYTGYHLAEDKQWISLISSAGIVGIAPICVDDNDESNRVYAGNDFISKGNGNYFIAGNNAADQPFWIDAISNNGHYIVSEYQGTKESAYILGVFDTEKLKVIEFTLPDSNKHIEVPYNVFSVSDDGDVLVAKKSSSAEVGPGDMLLCHSSDGTCKVLTHFEDYRTIQSPYIATMSSNGKYIYYALQKVNTNSVKSAKHLLKINKKYKHSNRNTKLFADPTDSYQIVSVDVNSGATTPIESIPTISQLDSLEATNSGLLVVQYFNDYDFTDPIIYSKVNNKTISGSDLADKLGVVREGKFHGHINISTNGQYAVFEFLDNTKAEPFDLKISRVNRVYVPGGLDAMIKS